MKSARFGFFTVCLLLCFSPRVLAQQFVYQFGLVFSVGTHVNNLGFSSNVGLIDRFVQFNISSSAKFNFNSYGKRKKFVEHRIGTGLLLLGGKKRITEDFHLDALNHNSRYQNALGFTYLWYFDGANTSQRSGAWSIHHNYFSILFENDVFGGQAKDRFRSGVIQFNYRIREDRLPANRNLKVFAQLYIWTGETAKSVWVKESLPGCPNGYRRLDQLPYGKTSHGILSFGMHSGLNYGQLITLKSGIDSEQIRHVFQNKLSHDLIFMPKKFKRNTPHYPRLNQDGLPVFSKDEMRKNRFYFQAGLNEVWSN